MTESDHSEGPAPPIRVLVTNLSETFADLLAVLIREQPDMVLMGMVRDKVGSLMAAKDADVLILGAPQIHPPPGICSHLLSEYPELRIIVMTPNGERSMLYWRGLRRRRLFSDSLKNVVTNVRHSYALNPTI
jgi:hypothetical protein